MASSRHRVPHQMRVSLAKLVGHDLGGQELTPEEQDAQLRSACFGFLRNSPESWEKLVEWDLAEHKVRKEPTHLAVVPTRGEKLKGDKTKDITIDPGNHVYEQVMRCLELMVSALNKIGRTIHVCFVT